MARTLLAEGSLSQALPRNRAFKVSRLAEFGRITSSSTSAKGVATKHWSSAAVAFVGSKYSKPVTCLFSSSSVCWLASWLVS